jgi:hypothetical protein
LPEKLRSLNKGPRSPRKSLGCDYPQFKLTHYPPPSKAK